MIFLGEINAIELREVDTSIILFCETFPEKEQWIRDFKLGKKIYFFLIFLEIKDHLKRRTKRVQASKAAAKDPNAAQSPNRVVASPEMGVDQPMSVDEMLQVKIQDPINGVQLATRKWAFKKLHNCFIGKNFFFFFFFWKSQLVTFRRNYGI